MVCVCVCVCHRVSEFSNHLMTSIVFTKRHTTFLLYVYKLECQLFYELTDAIHVLVQKILDGKLLPYKRVEPKYCGHLN